MILKSCTGPDGIVLLGHKWSKSESSDFNFIQAYTSMGHKKYSLPE